MNNIDLRNEYANAKNRAFDQGCEGGFRADYTEWLEHKLASNTEIIGSVMPCFEFSGKATKYNQGVAVDTDGIALSNDILPHKAYTLEDAFLDVKEAQE